MTRVIKNVDDLITHTHVGMIVTPAARRTFFFVVSLLSEKSMLNKNKINFFKKGNWEGNGRASD